jgi:pimeloyl-ACP methyl ester carboxylesterase
MGVRFKTQEFERMDFISEFRRPTFWYSKLAIALLALVLFVLMITGAISGFVVYRLENPSRRNSEINLQNFPGHPEDLHFTVNGQERDAWFFPGLKNAPTVILCPSYGSSRGELLTLASALQDQQYNVLTFDFSGHGSSVGRSTLGLQEVGQLRAAIDGAANRGDVDVNRFGLWGVNMGAYVALAEATNDPRVRAIVAESAYKSPDDMVALQLNRFGLGSVPFVTSMSDVIFGWLNPQYRNVQPLEKRIGKLAGVPQLYLQAPEEPLLAASTSQLFQLSPAPHEMAMLPHGNYGGMADEEKRNYENRIVSFFLVNLPLVGDPLPQIR